MPDDSPFRPFTFVLPSQPARASRSPFHHPPMQLRLGHLHLLVLTRDGREQPRDQRRVLPNGVQHLRVPVLVTALPELEICSVTHPLLSQNPPRATVEHARAPPEEHRGDFEERDVIFVRRAVLPAEVGPGPGGEGAPRVQRAAAHGVGQVEQPRAHPGLGFFDNGAHHRRDRVVSQPRLPSAGSGGPFGLASDQRGERGEGRRVAEAGQERDRPFGFVCLPERDWLYWRSASWYRPLNARRSSSVVSAVRWASNIAVVELTMERKRGRASVQSSSNEGVETRGEAGGRTLRGDRLSLTQEFQDDGVGQLEGPLDRVPRKLPPYCAQIRKLRQDGSARSCPGGCGHIRPTSTFRPAVDRVRCIPALLGGEYGSRNSQSEQEELAWVFLHALRILKWSDERIPYRSQEIHRLAPGTPLATGIRTCNSFEHRLLRNTTRGRKKKQYRTPEAKSGVSAHSGVSHICSREMVSTWVNPFQRENARLTKLLEKQRGVHGFAHFRGARRRWYREDVPACICPHLAEQFGAARELKKVKRDQKGEYLHREQI
ncbi:uncharacterized protein BXZ73DRAFT_79362 [Epithele typhae]|uniref:uncharacterized protein n=1 Tax=Epithele typhae TaxID=378194 RepID=UPI002007C094|nr:uncharacterized protein BXZ73DRAFT_79362 [Epithele typhae]KAH9923963.1 hypothetical protein BXZ73DRAFT_79362 [Epithele typhae]